MQNYKNNTKKRCPKTCRATSLHENPFSPISKLCNQIVACLTHFGLLGKLPQHSHEHSQARSERRPFRRTRRRGRCRAKNRQEISTLAGYENEDQQERHQRGRNREEKGSSARLSARQARCNEIRQILQITANKSTLTVNYCQFQHIK